MTKCVRSSAFLAIAILVSSAIGCSGGNNGPPAPAGPKGVVKAKVTCEGKPVTKGTLMLDSGKGFIASGKAGADGTFELKGPQGEEIPVGKYKVSIVPESTPPAAGATAMPGPPKLEGVPDKFYSPVTSGVEVDIATGKQDLTIDLK
jgi:hypothetical protein